MDDTRKIATVVGVVIVAVSASACAKTPTPASATAGYVQYSCTGSPASDYLVIRYGESGHTAIATSLPLNVTEPGVDPAAQEYMVAVTVSVGVPVTCTLTIDDNGQTFTRASTDANAYGYVGENFDAFAGLCRGAGGWQAC